MKVALWMGGRSGEHDISLASAAAVAGALERLGHQFISVLVTLEGQIRVDAGPAMEMAEGLTAVGDWGPDVAFIAMHGEEGEDGKIQGALERLGVPYQGSGVAASALALDKARTKVALREAGLPVAADRVIDHGEGPMDQVAWMATCGDLGWPLFLKTAQSGSSVGVARVTSPETLASEGNALLATTHQLVVEQDLPGREFTAAVLETLDGQLQSLPIVEIRPRDAAFFDYEAKYTPGATDEICPAPIDEAQREALAALGVAAHQALGCRGYSRTDIKLDGAGRPHILETNTLPGLTEMSLLPQSAAAAGMDFDALVTRLLALARA